MIYSAHMQVDIDCLNDQDARFLAGILAEWLEKTPLGPKVSVTCVENELGDEIGG